MDRISFEAINEKEATAILTDLAKAWERQDCALIQRLSERLPEGFAFAVFAPKEGSPCFSIVSAAELDREIPTGYSYLPDHQLLVSSLPVEELVGDRTAIEEAGRVGVQGDLDFRAEGLDDKSNEGGPQ
jgi:hypothetical protein